MLLTDGEKNNQYHFFMGGILIRIELRFATMKDWGWKRHLKIVVVKVIWFSSQDMRLADVKNPLL